MSVDNVIRVAGAAAGVGHRLAPARVGVGEADAGRATRPSGAAAGREVRIGGLRLQAVHAVIRIRRGVAVEVGLRLQIASRITEEVLSASVSLAYNRSSRFL